MSARFVTLPFAADAIGTIRVGSSGRAESVVVSNGRVSTEIALASGAATATPGATRRTRRDPSDGLAGLRERVTETAAGPRTELFDPRAPDAVVTSFAGELVEAVRGETSIVGVAGMAPGRWDVIATLPRADARPLRLPGAFGAALAAEGPFAIAVVPGTLHAFRSDGAAIGGVSVALPDAPRVDARLVGGEAIVLATHTLHVATLEAMPFAPGVHHAVAVGWAPIVGHAHGLKRPGVVVATVGAKILVDHPDVKRVTIERTPDDPLVSAGDVIVIDDVREPLPGILKVFAWHVAKGGHASVRPPPTPLELAAPSVRPIDETIGPVEGPARPRNADAIRRVASAWGFAVPRGLEAFLEATDADPVLCRWLARIGIDHVDVRTLSADWNADPCLVSIAGRGNGDGPALYLYPPALAWGEEPPVVEFLHEVNGCELLALRFDDFLARALSEAEATEGHVVQLIRTRLGIAERDATVGSAPPWLPRHDASPASIPEIEALAARGDLLGAERAWLAHYVGAGPNETRARDALGALYDRLGWRAAKAALDAARGDV